MRAKIFLTCETKNCGQKNYITSKGQEITDKIKLNKFCKFCRKTTKHTEQVVKKGSN